MDANLHGGLRSEFCMEDCRRGTDDVSNVTCLLCKGLSSTCKQVSTFQVSVLLCATILRFIFTSKLVCVGR